ncbi:MAG TPA: hypothetical protein PLW44_05460, partial [Chitinophagales bacterium]|nr:hypothetical protein [Chitinophagales bacterium]
MRKLLLMLLCSVFAVNVALAQCSWSGFSGAADINPNGSCNVDNTRSVGSGTYTYVYMNAGWTYSVNSCSNAYDNQLSIYDQNPAWTARAYNDDNGPACSGTGASINYTPTWTGWHIVINNRFNCRQHDFSGVSSTLRVRLTSVPAPTNGNMTLNGTAGNIVVCPGANIAVAQNGGNPQGGNYWYWIGTDNGSGWVNSWDYVSQGYANTASFNYSFANPGKYVIHTNASNVCGTWGPGVTRLVTVRNNNPGSITPATPSSMCQDGSASIQSTTAASSIGGGSATYYYYWRRSSSPVVGWTNYQTTTALSSALPTAVTGTPGTYFLARNSDFGCGQANNSTTVDIPFTVYAKATVNAGADATICAGSAYTLSGATIGGGASNGTWSIAGVTGTVSNSTAQLSTAAATTTPASVTFTPNSGTAGTVTLRLTTNDPTGDCPSVFDDRVLTIVSQPTTANAGPDQTVCGTSVTLAGNAPSSGTGSWSIISGSGGSVTTPSSATSGFTGVAGNTYTLRWTISNSPCAASSDDVVITLRANPTTSNAGADQSVCATSATLAGNAPGVGTGAWSIISGTGGSFTNAALNNTAFSGTANTSYTLRWTISNAPCAASTDDVVINL